MKVTSAFPNSPEYTAFFSMRAIGFSSGTLDAHDPLRAMEQSLSLGCSAFEVSALRMDEIEAVAETLRDPRLSEFSYVSIHAPGNVPAELESRVAKRFLTMSEERYPVVVHPDVIRTPAVWEPLSSRLLLENMDRRKRVGRFANEFENLFQELPEAGLCLDVAHLRQVDPTLNEGFKFMRLFGHRLREIHISEVTSNSTHGRLSLHASSYLKDFLQIVPHDVPVIIESALGDREPLDEVWAVSSLLGEACSIPGRRVGAEARH